MPDDDGTGFSSSPLPPEDRLWRHPSEVRPARARSRRRWSLVPIGIGVLIGVVATFTGLWSIGGFDRAPRPSAAEERLATPVSTVFVGRSSVGDLDEVARGLVAVRSDGVEGAGVVMRSDGHVLTTAALVGDSRVVQVWGVDRVRREGEVVGVDRATDLAVLRVPGLRSAGAVLSTGQGLAVGDETRAVNLERQGALLVLRGLVANLAVTVVRDDDTKLHGLIATDIVRAEPVQGAALIDRDGAVIGLTTNVGDTDALRAVPVDLARIVAHDIIATGGPAHPWLGIEGEDLAHELAEEWGVAGGAEVVTVAEDGPAAEAGLEPHDVITHVGETPVSTMGELLTALRHLDPGNEVRLGYLRDGEPDWSEAVLGEPVSR